MAYCSDGRPGDLGVVRWFGGIFEVVVIGRIGDLGDGFFYEGGLGVGGFILYIIIERVGRCVYDNFEVLSRWRSCGEQCLCWV